MSVRVPTSKILEYREAVREFVESKFAIELTLEEDSAFLFFQVPKNRVGEYKVAVEEFVKGLLEREGGAKGSESGVKGFANLVEFSKALEGKVVEDDG